MLYGFTIQPWLPNLGLLRHDDLSRLGVRDQLADVEVPIQLSQAVRPLVEDLKEVVVVLGTA